MKQALKSTALRPWKVQNEGNINRNVGARAKLELGPESFPNRGSPPPTPTAPHLNQADIEGDKRTPCASSGRGRVLKIILGWKENQI